QITEARPHDVNVLDSLILEPGAYYVMDRGYMDFARLYRIARSGAFFATRLKRNVKLRRRYSHSRDASLGILSDQTVVAAEEKSYNHYPAPLRRVRYRDEEEGRSFAFLTNNFDLAARTVADLFKSRWQIELFFKWIKQHLQIKSFIGHTMNAVKTQIWIAVSTYVLVAIIRKELGLDHISLYNILQVLSVSLFCYVDLPQLLRETDFEPGDYNNPNQLQLFNL
ncbi:IS4 family transposase, partial [Candidatus Fermentibacteria bacterium]|nr:IS4 family transposase [Candidatus Fermentibacteria bacterium]